MTDRPKREAAVYLLNDDAYPCLVVDALLAACEEHLAPALARKAGGVGFDFYKQ